MIFSTLYDKIKKGLYALWMVLGAPFGGGEMGLIKIQKLKMKRIGHIKPLKVRKRIGRIVPLKIKALHCKRG